MKKVNEIIVLENRTTRQTKFVKFSDIKLTNEFKGQNLIDLIDLTKKQNDTLKILAEEIINIKEAYKKQIELLNIKIKDLEFQIKEKK